MCTGESCPKTNFVVTLYWSFRCLFLQQFGSLPLWVTLDCTDFYDCSDCIDCTDCTDCTGCTVIYAASEDPLGGSCMGKHAICLQEEYFLGDSFFVLDFSFIFQFGFWRLASQVQIDLKLDPDQSSM